MDLTATKQQQINRKRKEAVALYPELWSKMVAEWNSPGSEDRAWLLYSANYLFRTGGVRWAIDPMTLKKRVPEAAAVDVAGDLGRLSFVLLTHRHQDHLDVDLLRALGPLPIQWVVPEFLLTQVLAQVEIPVQRILVPRPSEPIELSGVRILPFNGLHLEWKVDPETGDVSGIPRGVPAFGYWIEFGGKRWLFPGDTRTYAVDRLPQFEPVEGVFAHLWLGREAGLLPDPPLLSEFCRFCVALRPARVVVTHLEEFGRRAADYWDIEHFRKVATHFHQISPDLPVAPAFMGESVCL
jgi:L-ascorbate metabolism protein UlaG (beta-lactamase superfamily)